MADVVVVVVIAVSRRTVEGEYWRNVFNVNAAIDLKEAELMVILCGFPIMHQIFLTHI